MEPEFSELVAPTAGARRFTQTARPGFADCAPSGRTRLDALARWLQDVAYADVEDAGLAQAAVWVVRRTRMRVERFPRFGERFALTTFCSGLGRMWAERRTDVVRDGRSEPEVRAVSLWVHLDTATWRPALLSAAEIKTYGGAAPDRRVSARLRHPGPPPEATRSSWVFRTTELDIAGHVNNAAYWQTLEEELLERDEPEAIDVEIEYRTPSQAGDTVVLSDGPRRWIVSQDREVQASIAIRNAPNR